MLRFKLIVITAIVLFSGNLYAQGISGSAHDFSGSAWNASGKICVVCHTPHNAIDAGNSPLWNHEITSVAAYTLYSNSSLDATMGQPDGVSKLCLSCHDGTVALDNFGATTTGSNYIAAAADLTDDLSDDHPVSMDYTTATASADGGLHNPSVATTSLGGTIADDLLINDKLECSSCHDAHDAAGEDALLVMSNAASALCLTCHDK